MNLVFVSGGFFAQHLPRVVKLLLPFAAQIRIMLKLLLIFISENKTTAHLSVGRLSFILKLTLTTYIQSQRSRISDM